ncbi:hypothetical protein BKA64DRAFT_648944 [Cadophora sp. MPI-SDFR-AT-0126]|nr:hypothetical protein BKA64DRAFT_648944 [Leotiomycetes sp. MPI-SDFR-AT-0126]
MDFHISFKEPSAKSLTDGKYCEGSVALFAEIEGKIRALGLPTLAVIEDENYLDIASGTSLMEIYPGPLNEFKYWIVRNPPNEELFPPNCNTFNKVCLWTPWLINSAESISSLQKVFQMLENEYEVFFSLNWITNDCVMEVHVAQAIGECDLQHVKNTMAFLWAFEEKLDGLHEAREPVEGHTKWTHRQSVRDNCTLSWSDCLRPLTREQEVDRVFACKSTEEIYDLTVHPDPWGSLVYGIDRKSTTENNCLVQGFKFEQERPSLDVDRIENWLKVCFGIVSFTTNEKSTVDIRRFIMSRMEDKTYTPFILLTDIGLQEQAEYYRAVVLGRGSRWMQKSMLYCPLLTLNDDTLND